MASDALSQFIALVYRLDAVGPRPRDIDSYLERATSLDVPDAWTCLRQLQMWMASFPNEASAHFINKIVELASVYRVPNPPTLQQIYKAVEADGRARNPHASSRSLLDEDDDDLEGGDGFDVAAWLDKAADDLAKEEAADSMELFLFKTAALILQNMRKLGGLRLVPPPAILFFFTGIEQGTTHHVQRCAAYCSGVLSAEHLPVLIDSLFERMKAIPEKRFRWLLYQQATQLFEFGVGTQQQASPPPAPFARRAQRGAPAASHRPWAAPPRPCLAPASPLPRPCLAPPPAAPPAAPTTRLSSTGRSDSRLPRDDGQEDCED
jgi:hypothetical protein